MMSVIYLCILNFDSSYVIWFDQVEFNSLTCQLSCRCYPDGLNHIGSKLLYLYVFLLGKSIKLLPLVRLSELVYIFVAFLAPF